MTYYGVFPSFSYDTFVPSCYAPLFATIVHFSCLLSLHDMPCTSVSDLILHISQILSDLNIFLVYLSYIRCSHIYSFCVSKFPRGSFHLPF